MTLSHFFSGAFALGVLVAPPSYAMEQKEGEQTNASLTTQQLNQGYTMIFKGSDKSTRMWQWSGVQPNTSFPMPRLGHMTSVAFYSETNSLLTSDSTGGVLMYDSKSWQTRHTAFMHKQNIRQVVFDAEGKWAASASDDNTVKMWEVKTGKLLSTLKHPKPVRSLAFYPQDSDTLASLASDGVVRIWDLEDQNSPEVSRQYGGNPQEYANRISIDPKGKLLVSGSQDGKLRYWKATATKKKPSSIVQAHKGSINIVSFSQQSTVLSGGDDGVVKLWDKGGSNHALVTIPVSKNPVETVAFHPGGSLLASVGDGALVRLWDTKTGKKVRELAGHRGGTTGLEFIADGRLLVSVGYDNTLRVWDVGTGKQQEVFQDKPGWKLSYRGQQFSLNVNRQMQQELTIQELRNDNRKLKEEKEKLEKERQDEYEGLHLAHFDKESEKVAEWVDRAQQDDNVKHKLWYFVNRSKKDPNIALVAANAMTILNAAGESFAGKDFSGIRVSNKKNTVFQGPDLRGANLEKTSFENSDLKGANLIGATALNANFKNAELGGARLLPLGGKTGFEPTPPTNTSALIKTIRGHSKEVWGVSFSPDGTRVASGSDDNTVRVWDVKTGSQLQLFKGHTSYVTSVSFSPDGKQLASASSDQTVRLWDVDKGSLIKEFKGHTSDVTSVVFSPDSKQLATASSDQTVRLWDVEKGSLIKEFKGHTSSVTSVVFSPDSKQLASASSDQTVRVWEVQTGKQLQLLRGHTNNVRSVSFSPDGTRVASGSIDKTVLLWDVKTGKQLQLLQGHTNYVTSISFSPDGTRVASGSNDKTVRVWDVETGKQLHLLEGHTEFVTSVSFSPDGTRVASGSNDKTVRLWDIRWLLPPYYQAVFTGVKGLSNEIKKKLKRLGATGIVLGDNNNDKDDEKEEKEDDEIQEMQDVN